MYMSVICRGSQLICNAEACLNVVRVVGTCATEVFHV